MWNYVGIVRTDKRLARAQRRLDNLVGEIQEYYWGYLVDRDLLELRNLADVARLIVACAQERKESRGLHYTLSWPAAGAPRDTVLVRGKPMPSAWPP
jgi:L-aspartate oxidase